MSEDRFSLAVGAGERLNEHVTGELWPSTPIRHEMLAEAIDIFRLLWGGGVHSFEGDFYDVDHAQLYDLPDKPITVTVGVSGPKSIALAVEKADGIMATSPEAALVQSYRDKAGKGGPVYGEVTLAWAATEEEGRKIAHDRFRFSAFDWSVNSELRDVAGFEAAAKYVRPEDLKDTIPAGPDPEVHLEAVRKYLEAGFDHLVLLGPGDDQEGFIRFCEKELLPKLR